MKNALLGTVNYYYPSEADMPDVKPGFMDLPLVGRSVNIEDMRGRESEFSLGVQGFMIARHPTAVKDFWSIDEVRRVYYPEVDELIRDLTGCSATAPAHGPVVRASNRSGADAPARPVEYAHGDYHPAWGEATLRLLTSPEEIEGRLAKRYSIFNVWRTVSPPPQDMPLALCDPRSVASGDKQICAVSVQPEGHQEPIVWESIALQYNKNHHWFYYSDMTQNDVFIFRTLDSGPKYDEPVIHSAFVDETCSNEAPARISIEVRMFAFYD